jgi:sorbitol-specific phosphotransferase system component IIBC
MLLGMLCAVAVVLPLFATHGAAVAGVFVLLLGSPIVLRAIEQARAGAEVLAQRVWAAAYFLTPQFELFDLSKKVVHEWAAIPGWALGWLTAYAAAFSAAWLYLGAWRIARMRL